jgi:hypothetical protein
LGTVSPYEELKHAMALIVNKINEDDYLTASSYQVGYIKHDRLLNLDSLLKISLTGS